MFSALTRSLSFPAVRVFAALAFSASACWDDPAHELDTDGVNDGTGDVDADADADTDTDADSDTAVATGQGDLPPGWEGFGTPCVTDEDCRGYGTAESRRCVYVVSGYVSAPNGFCTACCDQAGIDGCAPNIDCVGADNVYVICVAHCDAHEDCRQSEGWECRPMWYVETDLFPGTYCLPDAEHVTPDTDIPIPPEDDDPLCPWPWLDE